MGTQLFSNSNSAIIEDNAVTLSKIQEIAADTLLGRESVGIGNVETITCTGFARSLLNDADASTARITLGLGTIATQAASSVTLTGILNQTGQTLTLNSGGAASTATASGLNIEEGGTTTGYIKTANSRASIDIKAPASGGIARFSPSASAFIHTLLFTNTAARTLTLPDSDLNLSSQSANLFFGSPNGSSGAPSFRSLVNDDIPNLNASKITAGSFGTSFIDDNAVTLAKIQQFPTDILLGRSTAGTGNTEQIPCTGFARSILDDIDASATRTTLGLGTIATQNANNVTLTGGTAALSSLDLISQTLTINKGGAASTATASGLNIEENSAITGYIKTANSRASFDIKAPANSGVIRVTPATTAFTHSLVFNTTANRTFTFPDSDLNLNSQAANLLLASPDGTTGTPSFRSLVAADIPNLNASKITAGTFATAFFADNSVTFAKFQQISNDTLIGRATAGIGNAESITCTAFGRSLIDDVDAATARTTLGGVTITSDVNTLIAAANIDWSKVINRPTTLAGYGITNAVAATGTQTVAGDKTFSGSSTFSGTIAGNAKITASHTASTGGNTLLNQPVNTEVIEIRGYSPNNSPAFILFNRPSQASHFMGLDTDNQFAFGGGSGGATWAGVKTGILTINNSSATHCFRVNISVSPANNASGTAGDVRYCSDGLYFCVSTNSWRRILWTTY